MKEIISIILAVYMALTCLTPSFVAAESYGHEVFVSENGLWYCEKLDANTVSFCSCMFTNKAYLGDEAHVTVPCEIDSYRVDSLGNYAFCECENLKTVRISEGIEKIGDYAFYCCPNLAQIILPASVKEIGKDIIDSDSRAVLWVEKGSAAYEYAIENKLATVCDEDYKKTGSDDKTYMLDEDGVMQFGWVKVGKNWYYFNDFGIMQTGWCKIDGKWYLLASDGKMLVGWQKVGGKWYYLNKSGSMAVGWKKLDGSWYYLKKSGAMQTGWAKIDGKWYYLASSGKMKTGWLKYKTKWYYLSSTGAMVTGEQSIDGKTYYFDSNGRWIKLDKKSTKTVYITKYGKKYHYDSDCIKGKYFRTQLSDAVENGLTPCDKCVYG